MTLEQALFHVLARIGAMLFTIGVAGIPVILFVGGLSILPKKLGIVFMVAAPIIFIVGLTLVTYWGLFL